MQLSELSGQIERITYRNEENGYTVAKLKVFGRPDLVTVVGSFLAPLPGEILKMQGEWTSHARFGDQFRVERYQTAVPATVHGIQKYLGSGLIKGIGPQMAARIVNEFGEDTLDVIEKDVEKLRAVDGIGTMRINLIAKAWEEQREVRDIMVFLQSHGVSSGYATKIFKHYGNDSIAIVQENPYRMAMDIYGIGFVMADRIAEQLGFAKDSPKRAQAGALYVLSKLADDGNVYYPYEPLIEKCREILEVERETVAQALSKLAVDDRIVIEDVHDEMDFEVNDKAVYLSQFYVCETSISNRLRTLFESASFIRPLNTENALMWVQERLAVSLAEMQQEAVKTAMLSKTLVITGGPGTGKTTIINSILHIYARLGITILLAAPTGRAAKRMAEATRHPASTIHRLLKFTPAKGGFTHDADNPLDCDLLVVDEASMIDTVLMHHLLKAIPQNATLILVGDVDQLPSVGAGNVLRDIIDSGSIPVARLTEIFRQAKESRIITNAHRINSGKLPRVEETRRLTDFYFIRQEDPERVLKIILDLTRDRIPARFGFNPFADIQVLSPMNRGIVGTASLNRAMQQSLNPGSGGVVKGDNSFREGDKVMQIRNNYDKEVFNGDSGIIRAIRHEEKKVIIRFDDTDYEYEFSELDEIMLSYAVSVHKSQGSEYPAVIIPVLAQHYMLLQRNLLYTAVTRGKELVILVGTKRACAMAVHNDKTQTRYSLLKERLQWQSQ